MAHFFENLMNPAGGLKYHFRALRHQHHLWLPFKNALDAWLSRWKPPEKNLILIGPSAGYCLSHEFLERFDKRTCVDPDPLARWLFKKPAHWDHSDFFSGPDFQKNKLALQNFLSLHTGCAVLFCNFLGQLKLLLKDDQTDEGLRFWKNNLLQLLQGRSVASFHDRLSGDLICEPFPAPCGKNHCLSNQEILQEFYPNRASGELVDHETAGFFNPAFTHSYFSWRLTKKQTHLIEGVMV